MGNRILVVEDDNSIREMLTFALEMEGFTVDISKNGIEALDILDKESRISFVLTDYEMPVMDGLELTKKIREHKNYNQIPIIITTSINDNNLKINFYKYGANDIILKPILHEDLINMFNSVIISLEEMTRVNYLMVHGVEMI